MTVLEWLKASTRFTFDEQTFVKIALERGCSPLDDAFCGNVTKRHRELMTADIIFTAFFLGPSSTSSLQQSHNGYQKTVGSETDIYSKSKIEYALQIYKRYDDEKAELISESKQKIKAIPIVDVFKL